MERIRIGTRGSQLALWQAGFVEAELKRNFPDISFEQVIVKTEGDRDQSSSLASIGGLGVFTKAIEVALLDRTVDIAVHSLKDLPSKMTEGLALGSVPPRGPVEDVLVTEDGRSLLELCHGAAVATGSIRRRSQLLARRPDLEIKDLRGNIDTRLRKLRNENLDAIVIAKAALVRLGLDQVSYYTFSTEEMIPGVGQGAIGVQIREGDEQTKEIVERLDHAATHRAVLAERAFLHRLDSGCQFPVGARAKVESHSIVIIGFVGSEDGRTSFIERHQGDEDAVERTGIELAEKFIACGALELLGQYRKE
ncbi:MAG: hydroxymethylbilane synthase [Candidatus Latescibacteria bacterium]|nr:hydroxymethylbilane synthase [Candidatus Latescibacterota bacterium]NIO27182.1 hydroxymethylbilane synthase [Candidatus Latescibacterota bacterium]NIO54706.1 hydroxymethylbilane synthase [Candidatus Latescibacterota bacterium]NIT00789.1 hydroxymethylbilane synthase [Candidatus Latescibacterota bacterium]NIT37712.1 hydroxymethylbilane synthase [Candidatus Latescibacterota bacterium]